MSGTTNSGNIIGSGSDSIVLNLSEDQAEGQDAQFTVNVDGQQIGGVQTVTASHSAGQNEQFTFNGDFAPGQHDVTVTFLNNLIWPGDTGDRNLYVDGVTYDGQTVSNTTTPIYNAPIYPPTSPNGPNNGNAVFQVNDTTSVPSGASATITPTMAPVSVGSGPDTLVLNTAEDYYAGDAQFTVTVDGQQIGGTQTTTARVTQGQYQEFDIHGNFGSGSHSVGVTFLNDAIGGFYPGTTNALDTQDRNLYVLGSSLDGGTPAPGIPVELPNNGTTYFNVTAGNNPSATSTNAGLFGTDGTAAGPGNPAIPSGSGSSGMSFISGSSGSSSSSSGSGSPSTTASSGGSSSSGTSSSGSTSSSTSDPATTVSGSGNTSSSGGTNSPTTLASAAGSSGPSAQDFAVPSSSGTSGSSSSSGSDTSNTTAGSGAWWTYHDTSGSNTWTPTSHSG